MSVSVSMVGVSAANSAMASAAASRAREESCKIIISQYESNNASIQEMQEYAGCVDNNYPQELGADSVIAIKVLILLAIVGAIFGMSRATKDQWSHSFGDYVMHTLIWMIGFPLAGIFMVGCYKAVVFLFS